MTGSDRPDAGRPLRVLHLNTERGWRGGERQTLWLAQALARLGHQSFVAGRPDQPLVQRARERGLPVVRCEPLAEYDPLAARRLRRMLRRLQIDVVHAHTAHAVALAALATLRTTVPFVASRRVDFHLSNNPVSRWKYARATAIIAISDAVRDILVSDGVPRERIDVVNSGVDLSRTIAPASAETLAALAIPAGAPLAVQVAQFVGHKHPENFVRAVAVARRTVPALHGLMVGDGPLRPEVERAIAEEGQEGFVHLAGYRTDADQLMASATVAMLSSREEGMGSVLLDALAFGKPVVATRAGGIPEVVEHERSGLLAPVEDAEALGAALARVVSDAGLAARLAAGALARADRFSMVNTAAGTLAVYRRLLAGTALVDNR